MKIQRRTTTNLLAAAIALASGCIHEASGDELRFTDGDTGLEPGTGSTDTGASTETGIDASEASSSEGSPAEDPEYPRPEPLAADGECPPGFFGPITFDFTGWVCIPGCTADDPPQCSSGLGGDAEGRCATNPNSSAEPCAETADCTVPGEQCGNIGMGHKGCLLPPSHCILRCDDGQTCPDSMTCSPSSGICQYTA